MNINIVYIIWVSLLLLSCSNEKKEGNNISQKSDTVSVSNSKITSSCVCPLQPKELDSKERYSSERFGGKANASLDSLSLEVAKKMILNDLKGSFKTSGKIEGNYHKIDSTISRYTSSLKNLEAKERYNFYLDIYCPLLIRVCEDKSLSAAEKLIKEESLIREFMKKVENVKEQEKEKEENNNIGVSASKQTQIIKFTNRNDKIVILTYGLNNEEVTVDFNDDIGEIPSSAKWLNAELKGIKNSYQTSKLNSSNQIEFK